MQYYIDITLLPDPEFKATTLMAALFNKFHRALVELKQHTIAVSFPQHDKVSVKTLGKVMRIHSDQQGLAHLMDKPWLHGMNDHITKTAIMPVPETTRYITVRRKHNKYSNIARLRRRYIKRHNASEQQAIQALPEHLERSCDLPFIMLRSASTAKVFPFYIEQKVVEEYYQAGEFNCYGVSKEGTLPFF